MLISNGNAVRRDYDPSLRAILNAGIAEDSVRLLSEWPRIGTRPTALWALPGLAARLHIGSLHIKDESTRGALQSFKALGAPLALARLIMRRAVPGRVDAAALFNGHCAGMLQDFTVISATDGNHGRALAAAAASIGCRCVIVLHQEVNREREDSIAGLGADIVRIRGNYDDSVTQAASLARENGWQVVSDTSYGDYMDVPRDVMQGYSIIAKECLEQVGSDAGAGTPFSHVFIQGGVGGLAAGVVAYLVEKFGPRRPTFVVVEPRQADCLLQSARRGAPATASGSVDSVMAGLACGAASPLAWKFLHPYVDHFMTIEDDDAIQAMRILAAGSAGDVPIASGESGAAGLAGLLAIAADEQRRSAIQLGPHASALLINTEGATAPGAYAEFVGKTDQEVLAAQAAWLEGGASRC